ncbi:hypothetical protein QR680_007855 [Steinernema hermaphroditum]|uniref:protein-serine/threonine phosphatase n=1 Tax=Steinernema hermaphroditum TaxID=289476 RepID=A0AA39M723_9BILA|nr:hypothetical protein QR680_007855 [Steinernema hermaphroditum]
MKTENPSTQFEMWKKKKKPSKPDQRTKCQEVPKSVLKEKRLTLLVDLDQTLIDSQEDYDGPSSKDLFRIESKDSGHYTIKVRPSCREFLESMSKLYVLYMVTLATRKYALAILKHIDPEGRLFQGRVVTRGQLGDNYVKTKNLKKLFPLGLDYAAILDDRQDAWGDMTNVVQLKQYRFFEDGEDEPVLKNMERVLSQVHTIFYDHHELTGELFLVSDIVSKLRKNVLDGLKVAIIAKGKESSRAGVRRTLVRFGADVQKVVTPETTVALGLSNMKKMDVVRSSGVPVVSVKWLEAVLTMWKRPDFERFIVERSC